MFQKSLLECSRDRNCSSVKPFSINGFKCVFVHDKRQTRCQNPSFPEISSPEATESLTFLGELVGK